MKNTKLILGALILLLCSIAVIIIVFAGGNEDIDRTNSANPLAEQSVNGINIVSVQNIAGAYVEDGSDEVISDIFSIDFENTTDRTLQYAKIILTADKEEYTFEISTIPAGATVRAMEMERKPMPESFDNCELKCEQIVWFREEPSMHEDLISIVVREGALIVTNDSDTDISAPIYIYYKNYMDDTYIGGITYRVALKEKLAAGETVTAPAQHFVQDSSELMFIEYAK